MAARAPRLPPPSPERAPAPRRPPTRLFRQDADNQPAPPGPAVQSLLTDRGPGRPLPGRLRESMELALGHGFAEVRIHTDGAAAAAPAELHARAFTAGKDIFFAEGAFDPEAPAGRNLLAHELAHAATQPEGGGFDAALLAAVPGDPLAEQAVVVPPAPEPRPPARGEPVAEPMPPPAEAPVPIEGDAGDHAAAPEARGEGEGGAGPEAEGGAAEGEAEAEGELATGEAAPAGRSDVELLMPPPPDRPSPEQTARIERSARAAGRAATRAEDLPSAAQSTAAARGAVTEPEAETRGRAEAALAGALDERPAPSPEILDLCEVIRESIRAKRPVDEDELVDTDPQGVAEDAGAALNESVEGKTEQVDASYAALDQPPAGEPQQVGEPFETPPAEAALPDLHAADAAPDPIPAENLSLDADAEHADAQITAAGMDTAPAQVAQEGPVAEARAARGEFGELAQQSPAELAAEQDQAIAAAQGDMAALQQQALESLTAARSGTVAGVAGQQGGMVTSEEATRAQISEQARQIFTTAQTAVDGLLRPLPQTAMDLWDAGIAKASTRFEQALARVKAWIDDRHSGIGGAIVGAWDALTGLPGWVTEEYDRAERQFGDDVCDLLIEISTQVNSVIQACELLITTARSQIDALFADLPESLRDWAEEEKARLNGQLDQLGERVRSAQADVTSGLRERAVAAVADVQRRVAELREQARGILGKIADAIAAFIDDPAKFIIEGILKLLGISPAAFWAVVAKIKQVIDDIADDPLGFANNLVSALADGFRKFFDHFVDHLIGGFFEWLFSGLGSVGVRIPSDFSLASIITFALELMGITWPRIREILARHIGEENVALLEKAYELISTLIEKGPEGIFEMIKEQLNPQTILDQILKAAVDYLMEALIRAVTPRILALFNPAGAIIQALELIYRVLKWIFQNAARIFSLIETVVNGAADLVAGNIGGMATAIEGALARLIAPVIDFLAGYLGLGGLPDKIADTIRGFQEMVLGTIDRVVAWLAGRAKQLLGALGAGGSPEDRLRLGKEAAVAAVNRFAGRPIGNAVLKPLLTAIKVRYGFSRLEAVPRDGRWHVVGEINPAFDEATKSLTPESLVPSEEGHTLLVGEGNFTFALSIAVQTEIGNRLIATDFVVDDRQTLETTGDEQQRKLLVEQNITKLDGMGVQVERQVDATKPESYPSGKLEIIVFNHPLVLTRDERRKTIRGGEKDNIALIESFLAAAKEQIKSGGKIIIISSEYRLRRWKIDEIAAKLNLEQHVLRFLASEFPEYHHEKTMSGESAHTVTEREQFAIVFSLSSSVKR